jgi:hypothetical protein
VYSEFKLNRHHFSLLSPFLLIVNRMAHLESAEFGRGDAVLLDEVTEVGGDLSQAMPSLLDFLPIRILPNMSFVDINDSFLNA